MAILTRDGKGSSLTWAELDNNFTELDTRTAERWQNEKGVLATTGLSLPAEYKSFRGVPVITFAEGTVQEIAVSFHMPKDYVGGTAIYPHGHVSTITASTGTVRWGFDMTYANEYDAHDMTLGDPGAAQIFPEAGTSYVEHLILPSYQYAHMIIEPAAAVEIPTLAPDSVVLMRVFRDGVHANDTYPDDVYLVAVDIYYRSQGFGEANR